MAERIVERSDGVTRERTVEPTGSTTIVERHGSGGTILLAIVLLFAVAIGAFFLLNQNAREDRKTEAVTSAAKSVSDSASSAASSVSGAADRAADSATGQGQ